MGLSLGLLLGIESFIHVRQIRRSIEDNLANISESIHAIIDVSTRIYSDELSTRIRIAESFLSYESRLSGSDSVEFLAENQITAEVATVSLPVFEIRGDDGQWRPLPESFAGDLTDLLGGTVTIFQKFEGGLLRVSTSVMRKDGTAAKGTYIPTDSPVYAAITSGESFTGRAFVVNDWYMTRYNPIFNSRQEVMGAIYVGINQQDLDLLREAVKSFQSVESYYTSIVDIDGNILIHPRWPGKNVEDLDVEGLLEAFQAMKRAILDKGETNGRLEYVLDGQKRLNYYSFEEQSGWIVISGIDASTINRTFIRYLASRLVVIIFVLCCVVLLIWSLSRNLARPIRELRLAVSKLSRRNFEFDLPTHHDEDTRKLGLAFSRMAKELKQFTEELEDKVRQRTNELNEKSKELQEAHDKAVAAVAALEEEIVQREKAEAQLRKSEREYRGLVSNLPGVIARCETVMPFKVTFVSDNLPQLGLSDPTKFLVAFESGIVVVAREEDRLVLQQKLEEAVKTREHFHQNFQYSCPDGGKGWLSLRGSPILEGEEVVSIDCVIFNINELKESDRQLQSAMREQAEQRGRLEMSASVLHDIGNAVTNVGTTVSQLASENHWPEIDELKRLGKYLHSCKDPLVDALGASKYDALCDFLKQLEASFSSRSAEQHQSFVKLSTIVHHVTEILHLQRRYSSSSGLSNRDSMDLRKIIQDALSIFSGSIEKRHIVIKNEYIPDVPPIVGDQTRLLQVFNNILKNACEAIDERRKQEPECPGEILISIGRDEANNVLVTVSDSGIGFEKGTSKDFFKRGFTTKESGSGIGVDQCHQILVSHGGFLEISSEGPMKGATVTITIPIKPDKEQNP